MNRKEFIKLCGLLGVALPLELSLSSCEVEEETIIPFKGRVVIIGAGAGGLAAGYLLQQQGTDFEILEASGIYGGRMKINTELADFPIPLGAEWLETEPSIFKEIVNDTSVKVAIDTIPDAPDRKFVNYSWYGFFEEFLVPSLADKITYHTIVQSIDYSGDQVIVRTQNDEITADKVIVSVPLKVLQEGDITFTPVLPKSKLDAISGTIIWDGFKAFFEFSEKFYEDEYAFPISPTSDGEKIYYNAALGQPTTKNILGIFAVGIPAGQLSLLSDEALKNKVLSELDDLYAGQASAGYIRHIAQNWQDEPFIRSGYMTDHADWRQVRELGNSVAGKVFFAGGEYTDGEDWVSVHAAARSARKAVVELGK